MVKTFLCRLPGVLKVLLPILYSRSKKTVLYLETRISRKLKNELKKLLKLLSAKFNAQFISRTQ
jgi:uncharacterized protein (DUF2164 family)